MLYFITKFVDWFQGAFFLGASLPQWTKKRLPDGWRAITFFLGFISLLLIFLMLGTWLAKELGLLAVVNSFPGLFFAVAGLCGLVSCLLSIYLRKEWQNRHKYILFFQPIEPGRAENLFIDTEEVEEKDLEARFKLYQRRNFVALPVSPVFGRIYWGAIVRFKGVEIKFGSFFTSEKIPFLSYKNVTIAEGSQWLAVLYLMQNVDYYTGAYRYVIYPNNITDFYQDIVVFRNCRQIQTEIGYWLEVIEKTKKTAGSKELKVLRERMEYFLKLLDFRLISDDYNEKAPPLPEMKKKKKTSPVVPAAA